MKVRVTLTVEVDPESWELNYGVDKEAMRQDVREWVQHVVDEQLRHSTGDENAKATLAK